MIRLYDSNEMARVSSPACAGCGHCCRGMGESVRLDPYDVHMLTGYLGLDFQGLLDRCAGLSAEDGLILPYLKSDPKCAFLNEEGRCDIHAVRPGICRLFPLGRNYDWDDEGRCHLRYFVVEGGCPLPGLAKARIRDWIGIPDIGRHESFVEDWHRLVGIAKEYLRQLSGQNTEEANDLARQLNMFILKTFYATPFRAASSAAMPDDEDEDFFRIFRIRLNAALEALQ